jgi:16S rRNA (guanine(966)-N(2))-methyltransferase RsmD
MRVIAGELKGRRLAAPRFEGLRPTSDKLRETLFNVLAPRVAGASVLDGCAGTGAVGIEALSRGAAAVTFVDRDVRAIALVTENLRRCGITGRYMIIRAPFAQAARTRLAGERFDLIFLDPPYDEPDVGAMVRAAADLLDGAGVLVLEHPKRRSAAAPPAGLTLTRDLVSGDSALAFYSPAPAERA